MVGRPRPRARQEPLTTVEQMLAPITSLGPLVNRQFVREILATPVPSWPSRFSSDWQPTPGGPSYEITAETARLPLRFDGWRVDDPRSITLRIEGSPDRRANDWQGFRLQLSGSALPQAGLVLAGRPDFTILGFGGDGEPWMVLWLRSIDVFHDDVSTVHGHADWTTDPPVWEVVPDGPDPPTAHDERLIHRGYMLVKRFATTMTARGKPGSGIPQEQRRAAARQRLMEAGRKLQKRTMKIGRRELMTPLAVDSVDGVAEVLRRADWTLDDLRKELNSTHTT